MIVDSHEHLIFPVEDQIKRLDKAGVDKVILFTTTPHPENADTLEKFKREMSVLFKILAGENTLEANMERMKRDISDLMSVLKKYPEKFYGFGPVPLGLSLKDTGLWIEKHIISNGLKGLGEFTPGNDCQISQLETVFEALEKSGHILPVWVHTFNPVALDGIKILEKLTEKYTEIPVIFGHMGGYNWIEVIDFVKNIRNAYLDLSAAFSTLAVKIAVNEVPEKCFYSSDAPYGDPFLSRKMIEYLSPSEEVENMILGENILKLLREK